MECVLMSVIILIALIQSIRVIRLRKRLAEVEACVKRAKNTRYVDLGINSVPGTGNTQIIKKRKKELNSFSLEDKFFLFLN